MEQHLSINCSKITDAKERQALIKETRVCFCCLKLGHQAKTCDKKCCKCGGHHHQTICFKVRSPKSKPSESSATSLLSVSAKSKETVFMMTASAYVHVADMNQRAKTIIVFDSRSQRLTLDAKAKETVNLNTFSSTKYNKLTLNSVAVNVEVENYEIIPVNALTHKAICTHSPAAVH